MQAENRWENDPIQDYAYPRQLNSEQAYNEYDSRYDLRSRSEISRSRAIRTQNSNREWVSGTGQPPYRGHAHHSPAGAHRAISVPTIALWKISTRR